MSRYTATPRPADLIFGHGRMDAINNDRCVPPDIGCGGPAGFEHMVTRELREYQISGLCVKCQRRIFA